ncbi:MAG TPA: hypothetical protein VMV05_05595 [bacterium]|nr:hypothetical protein [bacterium]
MRRIHSRIGPLHLFSLLIVPSGWLFGQTAVPKQPSKVRQLAYEKSGDWLYKSLPKITIPTGREIPAQEIPYDLPVDWTNQSLENTGGFPLFNSKAVDYRENSATVTAYLMGFKTKYYEDASTLFDEYYDKVRKRKFLVPNQKKDILRNEKLFRERSMVFCLSYPEKDVQLVYYPGRIGLMGGARLSAKNWLPPVPQAIQTGKRTDDALIQNSEGLLAIWNATFDKVDNFLRWRETGEMLYGGMKFDSIVLRKPQPEMATCAIYGNGRVELGSYRNLPNRKKIKTFVQNRFMVIENGELGLDSDPNAFFSFYDNIARSYLFKDDHGRIGYLWTMYTPPWVLANIALKMGVRDMMLLDIHSPVSCTLSDPAGPLSYRSYKDYMNRSFDFVPNFFRLSAVKASITWLSRALNSRIQNHYIFEAFKGGTESYFALFLKNAPEAKRVQQLPPPITPWKNKAKDTTRTNSGQM